MDLVGLQPPAQRGIDALMPLDQALAFESAGDNGGIPVPAVAGEFEVLARQACGNDGLKFFAGQKYF